MNKFKILSILMLALLLGACGGGSGGDDCVGGSIAGACDVNEGGEDVSVIDDVIVDDDDVADTDQGLVVMGSGTSDAFNPQIIDSGNINVLAAGGSVELSVTFFLADGSGTLSPYTEAVNVTFSSDCVTGGLATFDPASTVVTVEGRASTTYTAQGCDTGAGGEVITARANIDGTDLSSSTSIVVAGADVGSIEFVQADPVVIGLKGTGGEGIPEQSTVRFRVVDETKGPVAGKTVNFSLNTQVGGITLQPASAVSDSSGFVQTVVQSGTVQTSVRVTATEQETGISTQSSRLTISTGIPHQDAFAIALSTINTETFNIFGVDVDVTVWLSDRFQNPVPDGTAVSFTAEGGQIENSCATVGGSCTVVWTSSEPRPTVALPGDIAGQSGGRVTIVATAIGEESFTDQNGDFVFDSGEVFTDLGEPFRDDNENGVYDDGIDGFFLDFDSSGTHLGSADALDGQYNGLLCASGCASNPTTGISASIVLVMGTSQMVLIPSADPLIVGTDGFADLAVAVTDQNGNLPPAGTVISITDIAGGSIVGKDAYTVPDIVDNDPQAFVATFTVKGQSDPASGKIFISAKTPSEFETTIDVDLTVQ